MKLIQVDCPVCSKNDYKVLYPDTLGEAPPVFGYKWTPAVLKRYRTVMCNCCGHVYSNPRLENMYQYYKDVVDNNYLENEHLRIQTAKKIIKTIQAFAPKGKLLDIGCSTGDFLSVAKDFYEAEGIELSHWAFEITQRRGLRVHIKYLSEMAQSGKLFDVVTLWGVVEHLENPAGEIRHINRLSNMGGIVCLWTGDTDSIFFRVMRKKWWYLMGQHIQLFSKKSLDRLMRDNGFEPAYKGIYPYTMSFEYLAILLNRYRFVGSLAKNIFRAFNLEKRLFTFKKSDEMFAIYRKIKECRT